MKRPTWLNRGFVIGFSLAAGISVAVAIWLTQDIRARERERFAGEIQKKQQEAQRVQEGEEQARKVRAHQQCKILITAIQAYTNNPANPDSTPPSDLLELVRPAFGGRSLLKRGIDDLLDPWGKHFQLRAVSQRERPELENMLLWTVATDGTPISQFGIGDESQVK